LSIAALQAQYYWGFSVIPRIGQRGWRGAVFEHEATTSKISEDMLFYCTSLIRSARAQSRSK
jgi:hypothetical protein